jgi:hypothetical protein
MNIPLSAWIPSYFIKKPEPPPKDTRIHIVALNALKAGVDSCWKVVMLPINGVVWIGNGFFKSLNAAHLMVAFTVALVAYRVGLGSIGDKLYDYVAKQPFGDILPAPLARQAMQVLSGSRNWLGKKPTLTITIGLG